MFPTSHPRKFTALHAPKADTEVMDRYPSIVDETKSWLAINPIIGCILGCKYCFRVQWSIGDTPSLIYTPEESVKALLRHPRFVEGHTPIAVNVCATDPFIPQSKEFTFKCLQLLDNSGISNVVGLTTKFGLTEHDLEVIKSCKNLRIVILISYAAMPENIEPFPSKPRIDTLRLLSISKVPTILYFRPIVRRWNDDSESILKVLSLGQQYSDATAIGGLRLSPRIMRVLEAANGAIPYRSLRFQSKVMPRTILARVRQCYQRAGFTIPLFIRTKCAVHLISKVHYNLQVSWGENIDCDRDCSKEEIRTCYECHGGKR